MGFLSIDESKCKKDGICASECPTAIIRLQEGDGYPEQVPGSEDSCLLCGHCVAVCPNGALSHAHVPIEACPPIKKDLTINEDQAVQFLRSRRSIRVFRDKPVEKEKIQRLLDIARYAPTGSNSQTLEWQVFTDKAKIHEFAELVVGWFRSMLKKDLQPPLPAYIPRMVAGWDAGHDGVMRNAPALIVASAPKEIRNGTVDLTITLSYLDLIAPKIGLGTCWAGMLQGALLSLPSLREAVGIPEGHSHHYPMMIGYPKLKYQRLIERKPPKVTWN